MRRSALILGSCGLAAAPLLSGCGIFGCGSPDKANITLRKEIQQLVATTQRLATDLDAARTRIVGLEQQASTVPVLPDTRLQRLFTAQRVEVGRLTHAINTDPNAPADNAVRVYVSPQDGDGDTIKATGEYTIEIFDLARPGDQRIATCTYTAEESRKQWVGLLSRAFVFDCPLKTPPAGQELTVKVTFRDELTQRVLTHQRAVKLKAP